LKPFRLPADSGKITVLFGIARALFPEPASLRDQSRSTSAWKLGIDVEQNQEQERTMTTSAINGMNSESQMNSISPSEKKSAGMVISPQEEIEQDKIPTFAECEGRLESGAKTPGCPGTTISRAYWWIIGEQLFRPGAVIAGTWGRVTPGPLRRISHEAVRYLNRRGYYVRWFITLYGRGAPELFECRNSSGDTLYVRLKVSPNTLTTVEEVARYCEDEILAFRREMKNNPRKPCEQYEILVTTLGEHFPVEVTPDTLIDKRPKVSSGTGNPWKRTLRASHPATRLPKKIQSIRKQPAEIAEVPS
jgi:hypothetical protein